MEAQEPTDLSILLEWSGFDLDGPAEGHLGVGFPTALEAVDVRAHAAEEIDALVRHGTGERSDVLLDVLPRAADDFFRLRRARPESTVAVPAGFAVVVVLAGTGELAAGAVLPVSRGDVLAVPYDAGDWVLRGEVDAVVCRPGSVPPDR